MNRRALQISQARATQSISNQLRFNQPINMEQTVHVRRPIGENRSVKTFTQGLKTIIFNSTNVHRFIHGYIRGRPRQIVRHVTNRVGSRGVNKPPVDLIVPISRSNITGSPEHGKNVSGLRRGPGLLSRLALFKVRIRLTVFRFQIIRFRRVRTQDDFRGYLYLLMNSNTVISHGLFNF